MTDIQELSFGEIDQVAGGVAGYIIGFLVGSIGGGMFYDMVKGVANGTIEAPPTPNLGFH
ncbi:MAG: hypothetical protein E6Q40_08605 [Cupriavidus sp.]|nr:MAG: hypothetical protein E6Q40_08605 [Cupriavidus sp.]